MSARRFCCWCLTLIAILLTSNVSRADLVGWWTFDDVVGDTVPDSSAFNNDGTLMFGATTSDDVPEFFSTGRSLELAGFDQHVLVDHADSLDIPEAITIAAWIKPVGNVGWDAIIAKSPSDDSLANHAGNYELRVENASRSLTFLNQQGGVNDTIPYFGGPVIADSVWQHVAVTVNEEGVTFFRNGIQHSTRPLGGAMFFGATNTNPLYIGSRADLFTTMDGLIDDLRLYNEVLSVEAIQALAGAEPPPPPPADLLTASIHSVSSELVTNFRRGAENVVNGSGLFANGTHSIGPDGTMWLNAGNGCCGDAPDPLQPEAEIVFDLGSVVSLDRVKVWNYNETLPGRENLLFRGVAEANILTAGDDEVFSTFASNVQLEMAPGDELVDFGQIIDLAGINARYVKLELLSNFEGDNDFLGLSEVQFFQRMVNGDFNHDGQLDALDIDLLTNQVLAGTHDAAFDLNDDALVNDTDRNIWIDDIKRTWPGDADMSGAFDTSDLVQVFGRGEYEDAAVGNSGWADGDWSGDLEFGSGDLVAAFQAGGYEQGPKPNAAVAAVPEPATGSMLTLALLLLGTTARRRSAR